MDGNRWLINEFFGMRVNPPGTGNPATFDGTLVRGSFYVIGKIDNYGDDISESLRNAYRLGHEIGNHSYVDEGGLTRDEWREHIQKTNEWITRPVSEGGLGVPKSEVYGFRAPQDRYNAELYEVLAELGFSYDASIVDGYEPDKDGTNMYWPYTLHQGSPSADWMKENEYRGSDTPPGPHPALWEMPVNIYWVPPELQEKYGERTYGCDWNWINQDEMTPEDMVSVFRYNLNLRMNSNRAPLHLCIHSQFFGVEKWFTDKQRRKIAEMRVALSAMLDYALNQAEVRVVRSIDVINWMKNPVPLGEAHLVP